MENPKLFILRIVKSNQPHMEKLGFTVFMVDDRIRMSITELNNEDYLHPVPQLEDDEYEEGPGNDDPPE